jgi:sulfate adenylyltransferase subunit 1
MSWDSASVLALKNGLRFFGREIHPAEKAEIMEGLAEAVPIPERLPHEVDSPTPCVLRFITCGSVDDGKSTLIGRLLHDTKQILEDQYASVAQASQRRGFAAPDLSLFTDGLEAEREQGITIDVAYRYFATPRRKFIVADTPGHEQYTRNMATGASTADAAVLLADVTKGLLPQGRRHLYLAHLLGIREIVVAVNKMDLVGYARDPFEAVREAFTAFATPLGVPRLRFVPVSALAGDLVVERGSAMPWYRGPTLLEILDSIEPARAAIARPLRFPVQLVQRANGTRRYLGRVAAGMVRAGDEVLVMPAGRRTFVSGIHALAGGRAAAQAGDSVALALAHELDVSRGDCIAHPAQPPKAARELDATLVWLAEQPLAPRTRYLLKHTTRTVSARLAALEHVVDIHSLGPRSDGSNLGMNDIGRVTLELAQPVFADAYADERATGAFILIDAASRHTVAAGMIR